MIGIFLEQLSAHPRLGHVKVEAREPRPGVLQLEGVVPTWQDVVDVGHIAGKLNGVRSVVNLLQSEDYTGPPAEQLEAEHNHNLDAAKALPNLPAADVVIVGAGVTGAAVARQLAKYDLKITVVDKLNDISEGTTKANNGMIHAGHDPKFGTLKARLNVQGNAMYDQWADELQFDFRRTGLLLNIYREEEDEALDAMYLNAVQNGVPGVRLVSKEEAYAMEPNMIQDIRRSMWVPTAGYVEPYEVVQALLENAMQNGATVMTSTEVLGVETENGAVCAVVTSAGRIPTKCVVNAAGLYADSVAAMVDDMFYTIHPRKGTLLIFDRACAPNATFACMAILPSAFSKGGGNMITPTDNHLWGPSAKETPDRENTAVDPDEFDEVIDKCFTNGISRSDLITFFCGVRAPVYTEDFIIEASEVVQGFIHVAGMQSPALAAAPAVAQMVEEIYLTQFTPAPRPDYQPRRPAPVKFSRLSREEQDAAARKDKKYGRIVCRCETVTEAEVLEAIRAPIPATTMDGVKRRTRCGMGRCHGGFCGPRVMDLLAREAGAPLESITKHGPGSEMLSGQNRQVAP